MKRNGYLDFLKIIATVTIVFHHWQQSTGAYFEKGINFWNGRFYWGYIVELFFVISGFCIYKYQKIIYDNEISLGAFWIKRLMRLAPMLFVGACFYEVTIILYGHLYGGDWFGIKPSLWGIITDTLAIQEGWVFTNPYVNNPTWYCSVLMLCYLFFYLTVKIAKKCTVSPVYMYVVMIFLGCGIRTYGTNWAFFNATTCRGFYAFFAGVILAHVTENYTIKKSHRLICAFCVILFVWTYYYHADWIGNDTPLLLTFVVYPSLIIVLSSSCFSAVFNRKVFGELGKICYSVLLCIIR